MKKITSLFLSAVMLLALAGCSSTNGTAGGSGAETESAYEQALDVLTAVFDAYAEEELFAIYGGNQENVVMDAPGKFDISKTEELKGTLGLPEGLVADIDDAASMVHLMNGNIFTGAVYHLKDGVDMEAFADEAKNGILATQWLCGQPDTLVIINVDGRYVITAYGEGEIMEIFKSNALSALGGAKVITESPVA